MVRSQPIRTKPGKRSGEFIVTMPAGWELRLRRVVKETMDEALPDPREKGLTDYQKEQRSQLRRQRMRDAVCRFVSDLITADVVGKEVALSTRNRFGRRTGSLREHVEAILREVSVR